MSKQLVENCTTHHKSLKLRIYPTKEQTQLINQTFGCCRKLYNEHLQERNEFYLREEHRFGWLKCYCAFDKKTNQELAIIKKRIDGDHISICY